MNEGLKEVAKISSERGLFYLLSRVGGMFRNRLRIYLINRRDNAEISNSVKISKSATLGRRGKVSIDKESKIYRYAELLPYGGHIKIGSHCSVHPFTILYGHGGLNIGDGVRIACHTTIIPANQKFKSLKVPIRKQGLKKEGIEIKDDVWIGTGSRILDGVKIGTGSVIGAGSVVTKDVPPYKVVAGNPAKVISERNDT